MACLPKVRITDWIMLIFAILIHGLQLTALILPHISGTIFYQEGFTLHSMVIALVQVVSFISALLMTRLYFQRKGGIRVQLSLFIHSTLFLVWIVVYALMHHPVPYLVVLESHALSCGYFLNIVAIFCIVFAQQEHEERNWSSNVFTNSNHLTPLNPRLSNDVERN